MLFYFTSSNSSGVTFNSRFLYELQHKVHLSTLDFPVSIACFYHSLYFCSTKRMVALTLKRHNSFLNQNNKEDTQCCSQTSEVATRGPQVGAPQQLTWRRTF